MANCLENSVFRAKTPLLLFFFTVLCGPIEALLFLVSHKKARRCSYETYLRYVSLMRACILLLRTTNIIIVEQRRSKAEK